MKEVFLNVDWTNGGALSKGNTSYIYDLRLTFLFFVITQMSYGKVGLEIKITNTLVMAGYSRLVYLHWQEDYPQQ